MGEREGEMGKEGRERRREERGREKESERERERVPRLATSDLCKIFFPKRANTRHLHKTTRDKKVDRGPLSM